MRLNELLTRIDALRDAIDALRPLDPDQAARLRQKLNLEWNYHSKRRPTTCVPRRARPTSTPARKKRPL